MRTIVALFSYSLFAAFSIFSCRRRTAERSGGRYAAILMVVGLCLMLSPPASAVDATLPPQVQARQYLREIAAAAKNNEHRNIVSLCEGMLKLEGVRMDDAIRFYYAKSLMELDRYNDAEREIDLFLKSGNDDADLLDQALLMRDSLPAKKTLRRCRNGFGHLIMFDESSNIRIARMKRGSPSRDELREAANSPGMTESEQGELIRYLGQRIFCEAASIKNSEERTEEFNLARDAFEIATELGNADGMFMYGFMLWIPDFGSNDKNRGLELMRQGESKGGWMAKQYFEANPEQR